MPFLLPPAKSLDPDSPSGRLAAGKAPVVVNLASQERSKAVDRTALRARIATPGQLERFKLAGCFFDAAAAMTDRWVFRRRIEQ
jgi:cytoplasmic iron level regulating protein YaaA (DUF328/UPF0246 family)